jgi:hypothetical protein
MYARVNVGYPHILKGNTIQHFDPRCEREPSGLFCEGNPARECAMSSLDQLELCGGHDSGTSRSGDE